QLVPKFDCTHKTPAQSKGSTVQAATNSASSRAQQSQGVDGSKFGGKSTASKAYVNRNNKKGGGGAGVGNQQGTNAYNSSNGVTANATANVTKTASPRQSIIPKKKCAD